MKKTTLILLLLPFFGMAQVGIGTVTPNALLEIKSSDEALPANTDGLLIPKINAFPGTNPTIAQQGMLVYLTILSGTNPPGFYYWNQPTTAWIPLKGTNGGTLDQAYDFGGPGLGKTITADAGAVLINGTDGLVSTGNFNFGGIMPSGMGSRMVWNPRKAAFRAGYVSSSAWDDANSGILSVSFGSNNVVSGNTSTAFGANHKVSGGAATAFGVQNIASGYIATAFGSGNSASGVNSTVFGSDNFAKSFNEAVFGIGATNYTPSINGSTQFRLANATDRLFVIGNAIDANNNDNVDAAELSDAVVILKNGLTRLPSTTNAMITAADGKAVVTKEYLLTTTFGTLDQAYDFSGPGLGKTITADAGAVLIQGTDGLISTGTLGSGAIVPAGQGARMIWNPRKGAFRAGTTHASEWDNANVGTGSTAFGEDTIAIGLYATAFGNDTTASGFNATAFGFYTTASGNNSTAFGDDSLASGSDATAFGDSSTASGAMATAFGYYTTASATAAASFGQNSIASGASSTAFGEHTTAIGISSTAFGTGSRAIGINATSFGEDTIARGINTSAFGNSNTAFSYGETVLGIGATNYTPSANGDTQFRAANQTDRLFVIGNAVDSNNNDAVDFAEKRDALVVLKNGNVGLGTSTPQQKLHIVGNVRIVDGNQGAGKVLTCDANGIATWNTLSATNAWGLGGNIGTTPTTNFIGTSDNTSLSIRTNNFEKARILSTGEVGIGTTTPDRKLEVSGAGVQYARITSTGTTAVGLELKRNGSDWQMRNDVGDLVFAQSNDELATVTDVVRVGGGSFTPVPDNLIQLGQIARRWTSVHATNGVIQTSDANDKKEMVSLAYGLEEIKSLRPISFQWKNDDIDKSAMHLGFVAQEVQKVLPEVVVDADWEELPEGQGRVWKKSERLGMKYAEIIPVLVKAVQEQQLIIDKQTEENNLLKAQLETQSKTLTEILERLRNIESKK